MEPSFDDRFDNNLPDYVNLTPVDYDPFGRAAQRTRAHYDKANQRDNPVPYIMGALPGYVVDKVVSGLTAPLDALTGKLQVNDPETNMPTQQAMGRAGDVAGLASGGLLVGPEEGALGSAGGRLMQMANEKPFKLTPVEGKPEGITAYHGSPHDFDKFDISKIGTGEGAQAYGHGMYFAENEGVAKGYRDALAKNVNSAIPAYQRAQDWLEQWNSPKQAREELDSWIKDFRSKGKEDLAKQYEEMIPHLDNPNKGSMYQVKINHDPEHFLDWDKPLSEQPHVKNKLQKLAESYSAPLHKMIKEAIAKDSSTGETIANFAGKGEYTAKALREAGIPGIKYLDQGSRGISEASQELINKYGKEKAIEISEQNKKDAIEGPASKAGTKAHWDNMINEIKNGSTRNYVVFDDKNIDILKKYGMAGLGIGGAGAIAASDKSQADPFEKKK